LLDSKSQNIHGASECSSHLMLPDYQNSQDMNIKHTEISH